MPYVSCDRLISLTKINTGLESKGLCFPKQAGVAIIISDKINLRIKLQELVGNTLEHIGIGKNFLSGIQKAQHVREIMGKWDCIKLKSFCTEKEKSLDSRDSPQKEGTSLPPTHPIRD
jgi:hypothetical protein